MCPWVGPHAPSFGRQVWGLPSRVEYLSPQGVLLPLVYGTTAPPWWLELRGRSAGQATPSWTVYWLACHRLPPWLRFTFAMVSMQPGRARTSGLGVPLLPLARWVGWVAPACPTHGVLVLSCPSAALRVCGVLGHLAPVHWCARSVRCVATAVSRATWLMFNGAPVRCVAVLVRCPGPLGSCSPVCSRGLSCCVCGVPGHLTPVHRCARSVCCVVSGVSWVTWLLFTGVSAWCAALCVRCPGPNGSCSPVCPLGALCCVCGVQGHLAPVHRCARSVRTFACAVSWATWLLFTGVLAWFVVLRVRCPGPLGSCSPVRPLGVLCCVWGVLGHLAPVHRCARLVCCFVCAVSWAILLLFRGVPGRGVPSLCCPWCLCVRSVLAQVTPVHQLARCVRWWLPLVVVSLFLPP